MREKIQSEIKKAMLARDDLRLQTLRMFFAAIKDKEINNRTADSRAELSDPDIIKICQAMVKSRRDAADTYHKGNRPELAAKEMAEIDILNEFLPQMLDESTLSALIQVIISKINATSIKDMGAIMAQLRETHAGQFEAQTASIIAKKLLGL